MFIVLLASIVNACTHTKNVSLNNQKCEIRPTLINSHPNEYSQDYYKHYYPLAVKLGYCAGSFIILNDLSNKVCVPNKTEDLNIHVFNIITEKNESKILTKYISCEYECRFDEMEKMYQVLWMIQRLHLIKLYTRTRKLSRMTKQ